MWHRLASAATACALVTAAVASSVTVASARAAGGSAPDAQGTTDHPDAEMLTVAASAARIAPEVSRLWPGYWPPGQSFVIVKEALGALLIASQGEQGFTRVPGALLPPELQGRAWFRNGELSNARQPFTIDYKLPSGREAMLIFADGESTDKLLTLLFHEQFHGYQKSNFKRGRSSQFVAPTAIADRLTFASAAELERSILSEAISTASAQRRRHLVHQYLAVRSEREKGLPTAVLEAERQFERAEGTARFMDRYVASLSPHAESFPRLLAEELSKDLTKEPNPFMTTWFRGRSYGKGAALTYLIRQLDPQGWQARVEAGETALVDHLAQLSGFVSAGDRRALANSARNAFGYTSIRARIEGPIRSAEQREIKTVGDFHQLGTYRLVVEIPPAPKGSAKGHMGFQAGPRGMVLLGPAHLVLPDASVVDISEGHFSLSAKNMPFMNESGKANRYTLLLRDPPQVNGQRLSIGEHQLENLNVAAPGLKLTIDANAKVQVSGTEMRVRVE